MSRPRSPLPNDLPDAFSTRDARALGVPTWRLRTDELVSPFRGVRVHAASIVPDLTSERHLLQRIAHVYPVLAEGAFLSLSAAAAVWQIPLPRRHYDFLDVSVVNPTRPTRLTGVTAHRVEPGLVNVVEHNGYRVTDPASTWAQLATRLELYDLVAAGDAVVLDKQPAGPYHRDDMGSPPLGTLHDLHDAASPRRPKRSLLRRALPLVRTNAWSRPESHLRLLLVDAGLPEPELNYNIGDETGHWVKCVDLAYPEWRIAIEYQSAYHRTADQYSRDVSALAELARLGWYCIQVTSAHVFTYPHMAVSMVTDAVDAQQQRPLFARLKPQLPA
ncbi:hypothetical protein [Paramicrobacterium fandaimingii]|uniref:hypothetical protein n=1 Tax=Paramicrobacterium fandaimingii TaxID=2708079 RepID=UPI0014219FD5|nr:hypothetical protein [Microbacterium fandaimingii]